VSYLKNLNTSKTHKVNTKNCIKIIYEHILTFLNKMLEIILDTIIIIKINRHYTRCRVKPSTKWNFKGNRYK